MYRTLTFKLIVGLVAAFILAPLLPIIPLAFSNSEYLKIDGFTFKWIEAICNDPSWREAIGNSFMVALASATIAVLIAAPTSEWLRKKSTRTVNRVFNIAMVPLAMPAIVVSIALLKWYYTIDIEDSIPGLIGAHLILNLPVVLLMIHHYTKQFFNNHPNIEAASALMGLQGYRFFWLVILPNIAASILKAFVLAFAISFNEGVLVQMLSGQNTKTISKKLFDGLKFEISPAIAAASFLLMCLCVAGFIFIYILDRKKYEGSSSRL